MGNSVHKALANADGEVTFVALGGQINEALAELIGVDLTKGLGLLNAKKQTSIPIRCGVADFKAKNGLLTADSIVLDTEPVLVTGSGPSISTPSAWRSRSRDIRRNSGS